MADIGQIQLSVLYKQPLDGCYTYDAEGHIATYQELWKGNFTHVTNTYQVLQNWQPAAQLDYQDYNDFIRAAGGAGKLSYYYGKPSAPLCSDWQLSQAEVSEIKAGDNATLKLTWTVPGIGQFEPKPDDLRWTERWNVSWQSKTASLYAYCGNLSSHLSGGGDMRSKKAQRTAIENWFNLPNNMNEVKNKFGYLDNTNNPADLNEAEINIAKKIMQGKTQVIYHYPIVQHIQTLKCKSSAINNILNSISLKQPDIIEPTTGYPGNIAYPPGTLGWDWLTQGSTVEVQNDDKNAVITWTNTWWGAAYAVGVDGWDINFYGTGNDRWLFGMA